MMPMRNTGILLLLIGIYIVVNSGSFRDLVFGKAEIGFLKPLGGGSSGGGSWAEDGKETSSDQTTQKVGTGKYAS